LGVPALDVLRRATKSGAEAAGQADSRARSPRGSSRTCSSSTETPTADITCLCDPARMPIITKNGKLARNA
jgi:hypothetical protein